MNPPFYSTKIPAPVWRMWVVVRPVVRGMRAWVRPVRLAVAWVRLRVFISRPFQWIFSAELGRVAEAGARVFHEKLQAEWERENGINGTRREKVRLVGIGQRKEEKRRFFKSYGAVGLSGGKS
jgi:hypothetical protein